MKRGTPLPTMDNSKVARLPAGLLTGTRFRPWRWYIKRDTGKLDKLPWQAGARKGGYGINGHLLPGATGSAEVLAQLDASTGLGLVTGPCADAFAMVVLDIDYKAATRAPRMLGGRELPAPLRPLVLEWIRCGAYAEYSPSGRGLRLIVAGTLPEGHRVNWQLSPERLKTLSPELSDEDAAELAIQISGEVYTVRRWVTLTGDNAMMGPGVADWVPDAGRSQPALEAFYEEFLAPAERAKAEAARQRAATPATPVEAEDVPAALEAALRVPLFRRLWQGEGVVNHSESDFTLCLMLAGVLGGDLERMDLLFRRSALMRGKWDQRNADTTYGERTLRAARERWDGRVFPQYAHSRDGAGGEVAWTEEQRDFLLMDALSQIAGSLAVRRAYRGLVDDLFSLQRAGAFHLEDGAVVVHAGGLSGISERIGGQPTTLGRRLAFLARVGVLAGYSVDERGRPQIALHLRGEDNPLIRAGAAPAGLRFPVRPAAPRPARARAVREPEPRPAAPARTPIGSARWTMYMLSRGERDPGRISVRTGDSVRAVRRHLRVLEQARLIAADHAPTVTLPEFHAVRLAELARAQRWTRLQREERREFWELQQKRRPWRLLRDAAA